MAHFLRTLAAAFLGLAASQSVVNAQVSAVGDDSVSTALRALSLSDSGASLNGIFVRGDHTVGALDTIQGPLVVVGGSADVSGTVFGNVTAVFGDVTVRNGADVRGGVTAWRGRVIVDGGRIRGALRSRFAAPTAAAAPPLTTAEALKLSGGWTAMLLIIGLLTLVLAGRNLDATARMLELNTGRAFFVGVAGQLGFLPLLLLAVAAVTITVIGILLIPFLLAAAPVALGGLVTLGWLATALMLGRAMTKSGAGQDRAAMIRALVPGILVLMLPWIIAAGLQEVGTMAVVFRGIAVGFTWVAASMGLGAAILSRAGTSTGASSKPKPPAASTGWQTPTPIGGVAAARRPVPARPEPSAK